jgi:hypothetical protein
MSALEFRVEPVVEAGAAAADQPDRGGGDPLRGGGDIEGPGGRLARGHQ